MSALAPAYDVFISYSREDQEAAFVLGAELKKSRTTYYLDQKSNEDGDDWLTNIKSAIDGAKYFALIYSENVNKSTYVKQEVERAKAVSRRGWIHLDKSQPIGEITELLGSIHASIAYNGNRDSAIRNFAKSITKALWKPAVLQLGQVHVSRENCPYRPYLPYKESDKLFGRGPEIAELTDSIYQAVKKQSTQRVNERKRLVFVYGPSGTGKSSLMASGVIPTLKKTICTVGPLRLNEMKKSFEEYAAEANGGSCVIAIDQFEEGWAESDHRIPSGPLIVENIIAALGKFNNNLAIVLGFRDEYLAQFERDFKEIENIRYKHPVSLLDPGDAEDCIRGPAAELGIAYEDKLAAALVKALSKKKRYAAPGQEDRLYVEPVELQIVCEALWNSVNRPITELHSSHLLRACQAMKLKTEHLNTGHVEELTRIFCEHVTHGFIDGAVTEISNTQAAITSNYNTPERIYFALRQFVSDTKKRTSLRAHEEGGQKWVGRLPMGIVHEMTDRRLLKKAVDIPGEERFELVHDRLAEKIIEKKEKMELFYAANSLGSEMTKVKQKRAGGFHGWFEDYESTVKDMNEFKKFQGLNQEEAEFIFRSALAYGKDKQGDLEDWVKTIQEQHPSILEGVLHDALSPALPHSPVSWALTQVGSSPDEPQNAPPPNQPIGSVRINAAILLRNRTIQDKLGTKTLVALLKALKEVCLLTDSDAELEELCYTLATCPQLDDKCRHLQEVLSGESGLAKMRVRMLLWMRDKVQMDRGGCFVERWKALPSGGRASLTLQLYWLRFRRAFLRMAFIVFISTITTAVGAALMFAPWGYFGSSFTQSSSVSGVGQGLFHGVFGGITWGSFLSLATLIYWLILRGRRIEKKFSHWLGGVALSALAGLLGGIALSIMVLNVDAAKTMQAAGWLKFDGRDPLFDAFKETGTGWILPIYGVFLGFGVGWSMLSLYHSAGFKNFVKLQKPLQSSRQFLDWLFEILWRVLFKSVPVALGMALAACTIVVLFSGKSLTHWPNRQYLDCWPYQRDRPERCSDQKEALPPDLPSEDSKLDPQVRQQKLLRERIAPLEWRAAGMAAIIYAGAYSMMVGYLLALLTIRFGVEVPEDKRFLVADEVSTARTQPDVPAATETP